ncbi:MAG: HlyD family efflux transporter periplasmic adaptor subunit [Deltaproteobacteria bacterium]|nr:HlyD family efflux transporter periplasmic adaptor subunit [Deltaproteobacteria bacterium]
MASGGPVSAALARLLDEMRDAPAAVGVWLCAVLAVTAILSGRAARFEYVGIARTAYYEVSAGTVGTIERISVDLYDPVEAGAVVATLDPGEVKASLATAQAELARLEAEMEAERVTLTRGVGPQQLDWRADLSSFEIEVEQRRLEELTLKVEIESDQVEKQRLATRLARIKPLHADGIVSASEYDDLRLLHDQVSTRIEENRILLASIQEKFRTAEERMRTFQQSLPVEGREQSLLEPLSAAVEVQAKRIEEIHAARERLVLRSPVAGQISQVPGSSGQSVVAGEPVILVARRFASEVVGYLPERAVGVAEENMRVFVARASDPAVSAESVVLRISPTIEPLPERLWQRPGVAEYGRPFVVATAQSLELVPGERVSVSFSLTR